MSQLCHNIQLVTPDRHCWDEIFFLISFSPIPFIYAVCRICSEFFWWIFLDCVVQKTLCRRHIITSLKYVKWSRWFCPHFLSCPVNKWFCCVIFPVRMFSVVLCNLTWTAQAVLWKEEILCVFLSDFIFHNSSGHCYYIIVLISYSSSFFIVLLFFQSNAPFWSLVSMLFKHKQQQY